MGCLVGVLRGPGAVERGGGAGFECGFGGGGTARAPFSLRFFLLCVLFLVFDVEIVLLFPLVVVSHAGLLAGWVVWGFLLVLLGGLLYEWRAGGLDWRWGGYRCRATSNRACGLVEQLPPYSPCGVFSMRVL